MQTKDSCRIFGLADGFLSRGYATLCFDKRGVGQSTGHYIPAIPENSIAVFEDLASDMAAGVEFLRSRPEIDRNRIGLALAALGAGSEPENQTWMFRSRTIAVTEQTEDDAGALAADDRNVSRRLLRDSGHRRTFLHHVDRAPVWQLARQTAGSSANVYRRAALPCCDQPPVNRVRAPSADRDRPLTYRDLASRGFHRSSASTHLEAAEAATELLSTVEGRDLFSYLIGCALADGTTIEATVPGAADTEPPFSNYTCSSGRCSFYGSRGLAPDWIEHKLSSKDDDG